MIKYYKKIQFNKNQKNGQGVIMAMVFMFLLFALSLSAAFAYPAVNNLQFARTFLNSRQSYLAAESGTEDVAYRAINGMNYDDTESLTINNTVVQTTSSFDVSTQTLQIVGDGNLSNNVRRAQMNLLQGVGVAFNFGVQTGNGGFLMDNGSSVQGNVFSNGSIAQGQGNGAFITGNAISAGPSGLIDDILVQGDAYAHSIIDTTVDGAAYYGPGVNDFNGSSAGGGENSGSPDISPEPMPIDDSVVDQWKLDAEAGDILTAECAGGTYVIDSDTTFPGPVKIPCDLQIKKNFTVVTLNGVVWVEGNLTFTNTVTIDIDPSFGSAGVPVIVEDSDLLTSSKILIENNTTFTGSGAGSYVLLLSQNNSSELGGTEPAITAENNADGDVILYAGHGKVAIENNMTLKEVTAHLVHIKNNAQVIYESGLANANFNSGPSGGYELDSWREVE